MIVDGVFPVLGFFSPNQCLMSVGVADPAKVGHGIGFFPDDLVNNPKPQVLEMFPNSVDIMVGADSPDRPIFFQDPAGSFDPGDCEGIIGIVVFKFVPGIIYPIDSAEIRSPKIPFDLHIIRRISKYQVDRIIREFIHYLNGISLEDLV